MKRLLLSLAGHRRTAVRLLQLLEEKKLALGTIALHMGAVRFLYKRALKRRDLDFENLPLLRTPKKLPVVLSPEEVTRVIDAAPNLSAAPSREHAIGNCR